MTTVTRCGSVVLAGRPSAGKSTLLNALLNATVSITSPKPQTTRSVIRGVTTSGAVQIIWLDTPGMHKPIDRLGSRMMRALGQALDTADVCLWLVDARVPHAAPTLVERAFLDRCREDNRSLLVALNKIDAMAKADLLPLMATYAKATQAAAIIPISARTEDGLDRLLSAVAEHLPEAPFAFAPDDFTDQTERDLAGELIRRECMVRLRQEIPYGVAVVVDDVAEDESGARRRLRITARIVVEASRHRAIVIGRGGAGIKAIGQGARTAMAVLFDADVNLFLTVVVDPNWRQSSRSLDALGW